MASEPVADTQVAKPLLFVTVGTDHHPFDRLIRWVDRWLEHGGEAKVTGLVQSGTSGPARFARSSAYLSYEEMRTGLGRADVVVCHGGPSTITECRARGLVPIVVPRRSGRGEHVDDHQVAFARRMAMSGQVHLAETEPQLHQLLDRALAEPDAFRSRGLDADTAATVERFAEAVHALVTSTTRSRWPRRPRRLSAR